MKKQFTEKHRQHMLEKLKKATNRVSNRYECDDEETELLEQWTSLFYMLDFQERKALTKEAVGCLLRLFQFSIPQAMVENQIDTNMIKIAFENKFLCPNFVKNRVEIRLLSFNTTQNFDFVLGEQIFRKGWS